MSVDMSGIEHEIIDAALEWHKAEVAEDNCFTQEWKEGAFYAARCLTEGKEEALRALLARYSEEEC